VSTVHVVVGAAYCIVAYILGAKKASFERVRTERWEQTPLSYHNLH